MTSAELSTAEISGTLYVIGTPIGNLEDISLRALRVLREVSLIAAEDTRVSRILLGHYGISTPLTAFNEFTRPGKVRRLLDAIAEGDVAIVSDAGMPSISDPGYPLVRQEEGISVVVIPGPSAPLAALVVSGLPTHSFRFVGFLPRTRSARKRAFERQRDAGETLIAFESPHRLRSSLQDLASILPDRPVAVARELTKKFEQVIRGSASEVEEHFRRTIPRGEITLVVSGRGGDANPDV